MKILKTDLLNLSKKTARQADISAGINTVSYRRVYKNKKAYDRKANKKILY